MLLNKIVATTTTWTEYTSFESVINAKYEDFESTYANTLKQLEENLKFELELQQIEEKEAALKSKTSKKRKKILQYF